MKAVPIAAVVLGLSTPAFGQHQPYAGMEGRPIKALSEQQVADLKGGRGMGLALAAELNGYPGPLHVLELGDQLRLTAEQRVKVQTLFDAMKAEAVAIGERLIVEEAALDRDFAAKTVSEESLAARTLAIGAINAELRAAHLKYHLATTAALSDEQMKRYAALRGYGGVKHHRHH